MKTRDTKKALLHYKGIAANAIWKTLNIFARWVYNPQMHQRVG